MVQEAEEGSQELEDLLKEGWEPFSATKVQGFDEQGAFSVTHYFLRKTIVFYDEKKWT